MVLCIPASVLAALALASPAPWVVAPTADGIRLHASDPSRAELATLAVGKPVAIASTSGAVYVAVETGGVVVVDVSDPRRPKAVRRLAEGRPIVRLALVGDTLYLLESRLEAVAFDLTRPLDPSSVATLAASPLPAVASTSPTAPSPEALPGAPAASPAPTAKVVGLAQGRAIFDAGSQSGFQEGMRVRITSQRLVPKPDLASGGTRMVPSGETTAVLLIEQADDKRAMARLGRGDTADIGDIVAPTAEPLSERLLAPRRAPFNGRLGFHLRPFLGIAAADAKPVGFLIDLLGSYYVDRLPIRLELAASPVGFAIGAKDRHYPVTLALTAAYTTDVFEIGLGVGSLVGEPGPCHSVPPDFDPLSCEQNTGVTFNQVLRLGALDGLNLFWQSSIFSRPNEFVFGVGRAELNVPLTSRLGLFVGGGGGENGWALGELGVRTYVGGAGGRGTMVVSASLGVSSIMDGPSRETVLGPSVALGVEWRL